MESKVKEEWKTAYHEAGHAVVGWLYNLPFGENGIYIKPESDPMGCCDISKPDNFEKEDGYLYMLFAGSLSAKRFLRTIGSDLDFWWGEIDEKLINEIFEERNYGGLHNLEFTRYERKVDNLLDNVEICNAVKIVAKELIKRRSLKPGEFNRIMEELHLTRI